MKILIISTLVILVIIGGWFLLFENIQNSSASFTSSLNQIAQNIQVQDWDIASSEFTSINRKWRQTRKMWAALLPHHEIDNIDLAMAKATQYVKSQNISLALGEIEVLKKLFNIVKENEALTLTNIL